MARRTGPRCFMGLVRTPWKGRVFPCHTPPQVNAAGLCGRDTPGNGTVAMGAALWAGRPRQHPITRLSAQFGRGRIKHLAGVLYFQGAL